MKPVRTRFAPSPTGYLHVGNVRSALFPWLVARQAGGQFILRIEDTDQVREVAGAVKIIHETLDWLGITYDEGPDKPGAFGPYVQSQRRQVYIDWAHKLLASGRAYADVRTPDELADLRAIAKANKQPFLARNFRLTDPPSWQLGMPLRFLSQPKAYDYQDAVMGALHSGPEVIDDFILLKSDGLPTYNFAHVVDDAEMQITHVIRGLEYISSVPKYLNLYEALNLEIPLLAHLPHIMNEQGTKKLSKRDGAKSILDYKAEGYLPAAMLNFLASLGWNDGSEQEIYSPQELIQKFSLDRVQKSGARFDERRLLWMQGEHVRRLEPQTLYEIVGTTAGAPHFWPAEAFNPAFDDRYRLQVLGLVQERLKFFAELPGLTSFFFVGLPLNPNLISGHKQLKNYQPAELNGWLQQTYDSLTASDFSVTDLQGRLNTLLVSTGQKPAVLFSLIRIATTQAAASPGLADTLHVLGKTVSLSRLQAQIAAL